MRPSLKLVSACKISRSLAVLSKFPHLTYYYGHDIELSGEIHTPLAFPPGRKDSTEGYVAVTANLEAVRKSLMPQLEIKPRFLACPARRAVSIRADLSQLLFEPGTENIHSTQ